MGQTDLLINPLPLPLIALAKQLWVVPAHAIPAAITEPDIANPKSLISSTILIVDDAALIRRRIEASLTAYGYFIHTCCDGLAVWNWLQKQPVSHALEKCCI